MTTLFNRFARLTIESPQDGVARVFEDFRITFQVEKTSETNQNTSKISIYNLKADSIGLIEREQTTATLEVGYLGSPVTIGVKVIQNPIIEILAIGDVDKVVTTRQGVDTVTTFEVGDGANNLQEKTFEGSFRPGSTTKQITDELIGALGAVKGVVTDFVDDVFNNGVSLSGKVKDLLTEQTEKMGLDWSIQDGEVQIIPKGGNTGETAIELTPNTGLLGSPSRKAVGVEFVALLNPRIRPGRVVRINSQFVQGDFTVKKASFTGDTEEGNSFIVKVEAV